MLFIPGTALLIIPPSAACDRIDSWRRRFDPHSEHIPPHITIAYPPFIPADKWFILSLDLAETFRSIPPFEITLDSVEIFTGIPQGLWLRPQQDTGLTQVRSLLETCFPNYVQAMPDGFSPHMAVGEFEQAPALEAARVELAAGWRPLSFLVDRVFFAIQQAGGRWQVRDSVRLGQSE